MFSFSNYEVIDLSQLRLLNLVSFATDCAGPSVPSLRAVPYEFLEA